jgi:hypothetical protein
MSISDEFIPEPNLTRDLSRDTRTLQRWRAQRVGPPYIRMGRQILYRRAAVREWLIALEQQQPRSISCTH